MDGRNIPVRPRFLPERLRVLSLIIGKRAELSGNFKREGRRKGRDGAEGAGVTWIKYE